MTFAERLYNIYKTWLSPALHAAGFTQCRFLPTCSEYAFVAVTRYGWLRGSWMALRRLSRCHPLSKGGLDPVPCKEIVSLSGRVGLRSG
jgi:putative membrane protein insertion efficiency factor